MIEELQSKIEGAYDEFDLKEDREIVAKILSGVTSTECVLESSSQNNVESTIDLANIEV